MNVIIFLFFIIQCFSIENCDQYDSCGEYCISCELGYILSDFQEQILKNETSNETIECSGYLQCLMCPFGTYNDKINATECIKCPIGTYNSKEGSKTENDCIQCSQGYYNDQPGSSQCLSCPIGTYNSKEGSISEEDCVQCSQGYYNDQPGSSTCLSCPIGTYNSNEGSKSEEDCLPCPKGSYSDLEGANECIKCPIGTYNSKEGSKTEKDCIQCLEGHYNDQLGSSECSLCPSGTYNPNKGSISIDNCIKCPVGTYSSKEGSNSERYCLPCPKGSYSTSLGVDHCFSCPVGTYNPHSGSKTEEDCLLCPKGSYSDLEGSSECILCPTGTFNNKNGSISSKDCIACVPGSYSEKTGSSQCLLCPIATYNNRPGSSSLKDCKSCPSGTYNGNEGQSECTKCPSGTYNSNIGSTLSSDCITCSIGTFSLEGSSNCSKCSDGTYNPNNGQSKCLECDRHCLSQNCDVFTGECYKCISGYYLNPENSMECISCSRNKYCFDCLPTNKFCVKCEAPYGPDENGNCIQCTSKQFWENGKCFDISINGCINQIKSNECILCENNYYLLNGSCILKDQLNDEKCEKYSINQCESCENHLAIGGDCKNINHCEYSFSQQIEPFLQQCYQCEPNYILVNENTTCLSIVFSENVSFTQSNIHYQCKPGYYLNEQNKCIQCSSSFNESSVCVTHDSTVYHYSCQQGSVLNIQTNSCEKDNYCETVNDNSCISCSNPGMYYIENGKCEMSETINCQFSSKEKCLMCNKDHLFKNPRECLTKDNFHCSITDGIACRKCEDGYELTEIINNQQTYTYCKQLLKTNCQIGKSSTCYQCKDEYALFENECLSIESKVKRIKHESQTINNCEIVSNKGCLRCIEGYYLSDHSCYQCSSNCKRCSDNNTCLTCDRNYFVNSTLQCQTTDSLFEQCLVFFPNKQGCAICKSGYYKLEYECKNCLKNCEICFNNETCIQCEKNYFFEEDSKKCSPNSELTNCLAFSWNGCEKCEEGYYNENKRCYKCDESCTSCLSSTECSNCTKDNVLIHKECVHFTSIDHCVSAADNVCTKCEYSYKLSSNKLECQRIVSIIVFISICVPVVFIILVIVMFFFTSKILKKKDLRQRVKHQYVRLYEINSTNMIFRELNSKVQIDRNEIDFSLEEQQIPVGEESCEIVCLGNGSKHRITLQMSVHDGCDKYQIRTNPQIITLEKGEACDFEVYITPLCTTEMNDMIRLITLDIKEGSQEIIDIPIHFKTEMTTRLDPDELIDEKLIGKGSFGVVFLGTFRGNKVAIKKMKHISAAQQQSMEEFEKEVSMLDKFRSEYIIQFYGAVMIPNKICMVTEFAPHGSIKDMLNQQSSEPPIKKLRIKFMLDAAKGIEYLHANNILHRDIKPDNLLVVSIEENVIVNVKLTDFGSARNINSMMNNMSFTKGIGTPKYMAPEVLKKIVIKNQQIFMPLE